MAILVVKKLNKSFGDLAAVDDLSFDVKKGEILGIAGPNGAGKTTLFNLISGKLHGSGEIICDGTNINGLKPHQICHRGIARTFQIPLLFSTLSVYQNIWIGAHFGARSGEERINEVVDFVGLQEKTKDAAGNVDLFSMKLTMLAMALATKPNILLLDEPAGGLSPAEIEQTMQLLGKIKGGLNITIIVIEHLMQVLMRIANRLMVMHNGKKICIGPPAEIVENRVVKEIYLGAGHA